MKTKTFGIEEKQLKEVKKLCKKTGIAEAKLIRIATENPLNNKEKLKDRLWGS